MKDILINMKEQKTWIKKYFNKDLVSIEELIGVIEDLDSEVDYLKEKIEDMEQDEQENMKRIPVSEQIGISDRDFI